LRHERRLSRLRHELGLLDDRRFHGRRAPRRARVLPLQATAVNGIPGTRATWESGARAEGEPQTPSLEGEGDGLTITAPTPGAAANPNKKEGTPPGPPAFPRDGPLRAARCRSTVAGARCR